MKIKSYVKTPYHSLVSYDRGPFGHISHQANLSTRAPEYHFSSFPKQHDNNRYRPYLKVTNRFDIKVNFPFIL